MNKNNRKNRPGGPARPQRGRSTIIEGVYHNSQFVHAVTSHVGNIVQVHTASGALFEGIFRTFSPHFDIALELVHRVNENATGSGQDEQNLHASNIYDVLIFKPHDIVSIKAKDVDLEFATKDTFQTDTAISRCNGSSFEEKELEPWSFDGPTGVTNGELECNLDLDDNANGWDVNEMFSKNESKYGVQSTFDQSLTGYTVQIQKNDTKEFREAEEQAEKIACEIEGQTNYKERADLENGDEEARFAAVERPQSNSPDEVTKANSGKYVAPARRKNMQTGKLIRPSMPPNNNNYNNSPSMSQSSSSSQQQQQQQQQSPQSGPHSSSQPNKNNSYSSMAHSHSQHQHQNSPGQYGHPPFPHSIHNQSQSSSLPPQQSHKLNGDGNNNSNSLGGGGNKGGGPLPQRPVRHYQSSQGPPSGSYNDQQQQQQSTNSGNKSLPPHINKPPIHAHSHAPPVVNHKTPSQENQSQGPPHHTIVLQQTSGPPQPQRQRANRDEQMQEFMRFQQNFILAAPGGKGPPGPPQSSHPQSQPLPANQQQQQQQATPPVQQQQVQLQAPSVQETAQPRQPPSGSNTPQPVPVAASPPLAKQGPPPSGAVSHHQHVAIPPPQQQQQQPPPHVPQQRSTPPQAINQQPQQQQQQQSHVPVNVVHQQHHPINTPSPVPAQPSVSPPQQQLQQQPPSAVPSTPNSESADKANVVKKFQLNPAAKPFTPRMPITPNSSRPHTPQTPSTQMQQQGNAVYTPPQPTMQQQTSLPPQGQPPPSAVPASIHQHVQQHQPQMMAMTYVMQPPQPAFQTPQHPHATQQTRFRKVPVAASQMQVAAAAAAATGQPLLAPPMPFVPYQAHPQHYQQPYHTQMVRMYHETPTQQQQIQYLAQTPPSTTPSPGQPHQTHQQYHQGPQPSPGTAQYTPGTPQAPQFQMVPLITNLNGPPQLMQQYAMQPPHHAPQFQVVTQLQHPPQ